MLEKQTSDDLKLKEETSKILKGLALCSLSGFTENGLGCKGCPYEDVPSYCFGFLCHDAADLIKRYYQKEFTL